MNTFCRFRTDIDCCKKFMPHISGLPISPQVRDRVIVYRDSAFELGMTVSYREWIPSDDKASLILICWLDIDVIFPTLLDLEKCLRERGFRW